ncbi:MAG: ammonia-forming cytochrome c nitrite reductase subunit c552 [Candidatus Krumholzibacteriota bacterium]
MNAQRVFSVFIFVLALASAAVVLGDECMDCHQDPAFKVQHPKLYNYFIDFDNSVHGVEGLSCVDCHGGNPKTRDLEKAHNNVLDPVKFDEIPVTCGQCHVDQRDAFVTSNHYRILEDDGTAPNCATCHGAMEMDFIFVTRVKSTCLFCHNQESGILPEVPGQADYVLNKINIIKGYRSFVNTHAKDKELVAGLNQSYDNLTAKWHRFDLADVEEDTKKLLGDYRKAKAQARKDRKK